MKIINFHDVKRKKKEGLYDENIVKYNEQYLTDIQKYIYQKINVLYYMYNINENDFNFLKSLDEEKEFILKNMIFFKCHDHCLHLIIFNIEQKEKQNLIFELDNAINDYLCENVMCNIEEFYNKSLLEFV